jgi:hypothetical protein
MYWFVVFCRLDGVHVTVTFVCVLFVYTESDVRRSLIQGVPRVKVNTSGGCSVC